MLFISQDGQKAIDSKDILFYYISPIPGCFEPRTPDVYSLLVEPRRLYGDDNFGLIVLFKHKNLDVVKKVMRFLATGIFCVSDGSVIDIEIPTLYKNGMEEIAQELL